MHGSPLPFLDRAAAGAYLAARLSAYAARSDVLVLGLPRGGVFVAAAVASDLAVPLDVCVVCKIGASDNPELALGAAAGGGIVVWNQQILDLLGMRPEMLEAAAARARAIVARRENLYRGHGPAAVSAGRTVLLVDDGLATGASMRAAVLAERAQHPRRVVVAVPVGEAEAVRALGLLADEVVCAVVPDPFLSVGACYQHFEQVDDHEVRSLLAQARGPRGTDTPV
jgi:putative phosphoribosyl transferase